MIFKTQTLLNLYYILQVNFLKAGKLYIHFNFLSYLLLFYLLLHFLSLLWPYLFSLFSHLLCFFFYPNLLFFPFLPSCCHFIGFSPPPHFSLSLFFHQEKMFMEFKLFRFQFYFWSQQECWEYFIFFTGKRKSNNKSKEIDFIKTFWNFLEWQIYYSMKW